MALSGLQETETRLLSSLSSSHSARRRLLPKETVIYLTEDDTWGAPKDPRRRAALWVALGHQGAPGGPGLATASPRRQPRVTSRWSELGLGEGRGQYSDQLKKSSMPSGGRGPWAAKGPGKNSKGKAGPQESGGSSRGVRMDVAKAGDVC